MPKFHFSVNFGCLERKNMKLQSAADSMRDVKDVCLPPQSYWVCFTLELLVDIIEGSET